MAVSNLSSERRICVAITGASGSCYAERLVEVLLAAVPRVYLMATPAGRKVCDHELRDEPETFSLRRLLAGTVPDGARGNLRLFQSDDLFAPIASGSSAPTDMVVLPCSMGTLSRIARGDSSNLIERSADVCLKQKRRLIVCPRETPLNAIHLENMLRLAQLGVHIAPIMPAFYQHPKSIDDLIDFMVGRILELLELNHDLYRPWNARLR